MSPITYIRFLIMLCQLMFAAFAYLVAAVIWIIKGAWKLLCWIGRHTIGSCITYNRNHHSPKIRAKNPVDYVRQLVNGIKADAELRRMIRDERRGARMLQR